MKEASMATSGVDAVTLDPWHEPGLPLEQQYRSWKQRIKAPYDKHEVDAYTRTRVILMNGVEVGPEEDEHLGWAQTKLAELSLKAITQEPPPDPERLGRVVIQPDLAIKQIHAAPIDKRRLADGAKLPSARPTPTSRTSPPRS
jgi:hypothetical protein